MIKKIRAFIIRFAYAVRLYVIKTVEQPLICRSLNPQTDKLPLFSRLQRKQKREKKRKFRQNYFSASILSSVRRLFPYLQSRHCRRNFA
jgi:hypothetical protein